LRLHHFLNKRGSCPRDPQPLMVVRFVQEMPSSLSYPDAFCRYSRCRRTGGRRSLGATTSPIADKLAIPPNHGNMPITCPTSFKLRTIWVSLYLQENGVYSLSFLVTLASTDWLRRESTYQKRKKYRLLVAGLLEAGHTTLYDLERLAANSATSS
jgi:hypothetical protein